MTAYTAYEPAPDDGDIAARADRVAFVKDGFSWPALFVPVLWLIYQRMWLELIGFLVIISAVPWFTGVDEPGRQLASWITFGLSALFAFEANDLRGWSLQRRGYRFAGVVSGRDRTEAERAFFTAWLPEQRRRIPVPEAAPGTKPLAVPTPPPRGSDEVIGSFPRA